jgi:hypothetical protein
MLPVTVAATPLWGLLIVQSILRRASKPTDDFIFAFFEETQHPNNLRKPDTRTNELNIRIISY